MSTWDIIEIAFMCMLSGALLGALYGEAMFKRYLIRKAEDSFRTPACMDGKFYFIVPESEYVKMRNEALER